jgi:hypothetical protein
MEDIVEGISFLRNSASRGTRIYVEESGRLCSRGRQAYLRKRTGLFRVRSLPLTRRGLDALPSEEASIDRIRQTNPLCCRASYGDGLDE